MDKHSGGWKLLYPSDRKVKGNRDFSTFLVFPLFSHSLSKVEWVGTMSELKQLRESGRLR